MKYSDEDVQPMVLNLLWKERQEQGNIFPRRREYRSWLDKFIWNETEHPLNEEGLSNTIWNTVERTKNQKQMSSKFNPFKLADHIYFNGLNPSNKLSQDELDLIEYVMDYHSKTKYDYETQQFTDDDSTQFAYYKELEFCEYVKMVLYIMNNLNQLGVKGLSYDISSNKFVQTAISENCLRVVELFNQGSSIV